MNSLNASKKLFVVPLHFAERLELYPGPFVWDEEATVVTKNTYKR